jgi:hypothetical protein
MTIQPSNNEIDIALFNLLELAKKNFLSESVSPAQKNDVLADIRKQLRQLQTKGIERLKIVIDLSKVPVNKRSIYQLTFFEEEMTQCGNMISRIPKSQLTTVLQRNLISQLLIITEGQFNGRNLEMIIPFPQEALPPDRDTNARPSAGETVMANLENRDISLDFSFDTGNPRAWLTLNPHRHKLFEPLFLPYSFPLEAIQLISEAPPNSIITPSIRSSDLALVR